MKKLIILTAMALVMLGAVCRAAERAPAKLAPGPVDVVGTMQAGILAIGGETTGIILKIPGVGAYELELGRNAELRAAADKLDGKKVRVTGTLELKQGVEIRERRIIKVATLAPAPD